MQNYTERRFKWIGEQVACPSEDLLPMNYEYYTECEIDDIRYEVGLGAIVRLDAKPQIGVIHYFYSIPHSVPKVKKYIVALEVFYKPNEIEDFLAKPTKLDFELEIIKKDKFTLLHVPVYTLKSRCVIVYGLRDEDPLELFQEFYGQTSDTIYVCRYVAAIKNDLYHLKSSVTEENDSLLETDSPNVSQTAGKFSVTHVENIASNIKMKLKREHSSKKKESQRKLIIPIQDKVKPIILAKRAQQSPSELMKNMTLSPQKSKKLPSLEQVQSMNKNVKHLNQRKSVLSNIREFPDEDLEPIVILDNSDIDLHISGTKKSARIQTRRSSRVKTTPATPTRFSKRQKERKVIVISEDETDADESRETNCDVSTPKTTKNKDIVEEMEVVETSPEKVEKDRPKKTRFSARQMIKNKSIEEIESPLKRKDSAKTNKTVQIISPDTETNKNQPTPRTPKRKKQITFETTPRKNETGSEGPNLVTPKNQPRVMNTPRSGRLNINNMTPTVEERETPIVFRNTPMSRARMGLAAYTVPDKTPCRESEYANIYNFVTGRLADKSSGCMYISGVPGTGKTMTVCRVMDDLSKQRENNTNFVFLKLNALALTEPRQIYVEIVKKLLNQKLNCTSAMNAMEKFFKAEKKKVPHVILIDELDKLCNRKQDVVYNLLEIPFHSKTPLILITIANTMDLPERILTNKVNSRLGLVRLTFKPYQYKDLVKIVTERLASESVFKTEALELVARKVAAVSGDARRALAMCSRATEIAEEENIDLVNMAIVDRVLEEMTSSSKVQAIQCCSKLEQLILTAMANEVQRTGNEEVPFKNMLDNLEKVSLLENFKLPSPDFCLRSCLRLGNFRLLITQHGRVGINMILMLNVSPDDIHYALRK